MLRIGSITKTTKEEVLGSANCQRRLLETLANRKLSFVGRILRADGLDRDLLAGMVHGSRGGERPKTRYSHDLKSLCGGLFQNATRLADNRSE